MRRAVILFPSGFTLGNLFFGIFAIIAASRLEFTAAGVYVMLGGICDALDGRVARATNAGTEFGEELDSLVDAISFGLAPALIMYFAVLNRDGWDWVWVFIFAACAVLRLARFNIEQAGTAKTYFQGLPSPAAGITLASYYWFSQSSLYDYGAIADLKWHVMLRYLMVVLSFLMISNVPYPSFPRTGFRSIRAIGATILLVGAMVLLATRRLEYFFPIALVYIAWGLGRWVFSGLFERRQPTLPYDLSEGEGDDDDEDEVFDPSESRVHANRQGHRDDAPRPDRPRSRDVRPERAEVEVAPTRGERTSRKPDRAERPAAAEQAIEPDRARRDKKKERPERPERSKRPDRPERIERPPRPDPVPPVTMTAFAPPALTPSAPSGGTAAASEIPDGLTPLPDGDDDPLTSDGRSEVEAGAPAVAPSEGAPARKRKRRRRRGERKERGPASAEGGSAGIPAAESERSPYAAAPSEPATPGIDARGPAEPSPFSPSAPVPPAPAALAPPAVPPSSPEPSE